MTAAPPFFLVALVLAPLSWAYLIVLGGLTLKFCGNRPNLRIEQPYRTMFNATLLSFLVFILASAPILAASIAIPGSMSLSVPYGACLFLAGFIVFIQKIESNLTGAQQALISAALAGLIVALFTISQYLVAYVITA